MGRMSDFSIRRNFTTLDGAAGLSVKRILHSCPESLPPSLATTGSRTVGHPPPKASGGVCRDRTPPTQHTRFRVRRRGPNAARGEGLPLCCSVSSVSAGTFRFAKGEARNERFEKNVYEA